MVVPSEIVALNGALSRARELVDSEYFPVGDRSVPARTIRISSLIPKTAVEYAQELAASTPNDVDPYFAFIGNAAGDRALRKIPTKEIRARLELACGWGLSATMDGIFADGDEVVALEHKFHGDPDPEKIEKAFRQGALGLAIAARVAKEAFELASDGQSGEFVLFEPAPWHDGPSFKWYRTYRPVGVLVCAAVPPPRTDPLRIQKPLTAEQLDEVLDFYIAKATAVAMSVETGDMTHAEQWDESERGRLEFARPFSNIADGPAPLDTLLPAYYETQRKISELEKEKKRLQSEIKNTMAASAVEEYRGAGYLVKMVTRATPDRANLDQLRADGLQHYIVPGGITSYPTVKKVGEQG